MVRFHFGKLVRDKIVEAVGEGEQWNYKTLQGKELKQALIAKMQEEVAEIPVVDTLDDEGLAEIADVQEVLAGLKKSYGVDEARLAAIQEKKRQKKGGFMAGHFVESVTIPEDSRWVEYFRKDPSYHEEGRPRSVACSYAYSGEDKTVVERRMRMIVDVLLEYTERVYCNLFDPDVEGFTTDKEFINEAVRKIAQYDTILVIMTSERRSEGMLIEIGTALARGQEIVVAQHVNAVGKTYVPSLAQESFIWETEEQLVSGIRKLMDSRQETIP